MHYYLVTDDYGPWEGGWFLVYSVADFNIAIVAMNDLSEPDSWIEGWGCNFIPHLHRGIHEGAISQLE